MAISIMKTKEPVRGGMPRCRQKRVSKRPTTQTADEVLDLRKGLGDRPILSINFVFTLHKSIIERLGLYQFEFYILVSFAE